VLNNLLFRLVQKNKKELSQLQKRRKQRLGCVAKSTKNEVSRVWEWGDRFNDLLNHKRIQMFEREKRRSGGIVDKM